MHRIIALARQAVEEYVLTGKAISPPRDLSPELTARAGVFVCLKIKGSLRGCMGTVEPTAGTVAEEVINNAIAAAIRDPRFNAVNEDELAEMEYSVDVLSPPEKIASMQDLDPKKYGIIVRQDLKQGLLLPDLEGIDTLEEQLKTAKIKAMIWTDADLEIFRFTVTRYR